jgi:cytidylate kinase
MISTPKTEILNTLTVSIDGPAGSGKTTTAREVARRLHFRHLDTGAMYRAVTLKALRSGGDLQNEQQMADAADRADIAFAESRDGDQRVFLDGKDVTQAIRSREVTESVSLVSSYAPVRSAMVYRQRILSHTGGVVLEGRDIGSVVLPSAEVKIYLDASVEARAKRRMKELEAAGRRSNLDDVRRGIEERDRFDSTRSVSPLKIPVGAQVIDTTNLTIEEQVGKVITTAERTAERIAANVMGRGGPRRLTTSPRFYLFVRYSVFALLRLIWGLRYESRQRFEFDENCIFASNHQSNADPPIVGATLRQNVYFVAKESLFKVFFLGWLVKKLNSFPIRRGVFDRTAMARALEILQQGHSVLVFPEGRRVTGGELGEAKSGIGYLALQSGVPVVPVYVHGSNSMLRALFRRPHLSMLVGQPIRLTDVKRSDYSKEELRDYGQMVMAAIAALREDVMGGAEAG